jgi:hypothetical protein
MADAGDERVTYVAGLSLGQASEGTGFAVLERRCPRVEVGLRTEATYAVRHLVRYPPGTPYAAIVDALKGVFAEKPLKGSPLMVDQTAVGRGVYELFWNGRTGACLARPPGGWPTAERHRTSNPDSFHLRVGCLRETDRSSVSRHDFSSRQPEANRRVGPMIENYFFRGMRISWSPHGEGLQKEDGLVEANPPLPPRPMTYRGVDMDLCTGPALARRQHALARGLRLGQQINSVWLLYKPGRTTTAPLGNVDVLTGFMSGCPIVTFTTGRRLVAHVGTVANAPDTNQLVKETVRGILPNNARGFNPSGAWTGNDRNNLAI